MATRKRRSKPKPRPKSSVATAQRAAVERRKEREQEQKQREADVRKRAAQRPTEVLAKSAVDPRTGLTVPAPGPNRPGDPVGRGANLAAQGKSDAGLIAGLTSRIFQNDPDEPKPPKTEEKRTLADPALFGISDKRIKDRITAQKNALDDARRKALAKTGSAVFYGYKNEQIRRPQRGGEFEGGTSRVPQSVQMDDIRSKEELMSWLADETVFGQIKKRMKAAGLGVESYDDVAKLWKAVVDQAAATYSTTGKKVSPWAILSLRAKNMDANGKPSSRTTTSTSVEEMDPAQARLMVEKSATEFLGRAPRPEELEDFIAKAQTIARQNPNVTTTTTKYDFAGDPVSSSSVSRGGADVVSAKAQIAAEDAAKQDEEYGAYQAAGVYMPWLMDALASPI